MLAWSVDRDGDEVYELRFRDLATGRTSTRSSRAATTAAPGARTRRTSSTPSTTTLPAAPGLAARGSGRRSPTTCWCSRRPDEQFELGRAADPQRRPGRHLGREPRHQRGLDRRRRRPDRSAPRSVGGRRRGVEYHAEHVVRPTARTLLLVVTNDGATEFRLARCPVPRDGDQDAVGLVGRCGPRTRPSGSSASRRSPATWCSPRAPAGTTGCGSCRSTTSPATGIVVDPVLRAGLGRASAQQRGVRRRPDHRRATSPTCSRRSGPTSTLATGERTERHRKEAPGHDPASYVGESADVPGARRDAGAGDACCGTATRRSTAPRRRCSTAYGAYESVDRPGVGPGAPVACSTAASSTCTPHVRGGGEGGRRWWLDGRLEHKQHTFTTTSPWPTGWRDGPGRRRPDRHPRPERRRAARRARSSPSGRTGGGPSSPRCRSSTWSPRCSTRRIPLTITEWDEWGDPRRGRGLRVDAGLLAVRQPAAGGQPAGPARHRRRCTTRG